MSSTPWSSVVTGRVTGVTHRLLAIELALPRAWPTNSSRKTSLKTPIWISSPSSSRWAAMRCRSTNVPLRANPAIVEGQAVDRVDDHRVLPRHADVLEEDIAVKSPPDRRPVEVDQDPLAGPVAGLDHDALARYRVQPVVIGVRPVSRLGPPASPHGAAVTKSAPPPGSSAP